MASIRKSRFKVKSRRTARAAVPAGRPRPGRGKSPASRKEKHGRPGASGRPWPPAVDPNGPHVTPRRQARAGWRPTEAA